MRTCPVCGLAMEDSYLFCPDDGASLSEHEFPLDANDRPGDSPTIPSTQAKPAGPVVLYCPTCAAEYPLTFDSCPVHRSPLVEHRVPKLAEAGPRQLRQRESNGRLTLLHLERPDIDRPKRMTGAVIDRAQSVIATEDESTGEPSRTDLPRSQPFSPLLVDGISGLSAGSAGDLSSEPRSFRFAAMATIAGLAFLGILALYFIVANSSKRRVSPPAVAITQPDSTTESSPFIPTPPEARDYQEPVVASSPPDPAPAERGEHTAEKKPSPRDSTADRIARAPQKPAPSSTPAAPTRIADASNSPMPPLPRGDGGGFDARLIRIRSNRTTAGVRYDLTFNILEQAGRPAQWQRLLITTRSASGLSHSQAVPFVHRLGPAGALTFTLSVEMAGRSEADWKGRVLCTALGWDNNDRQVESRFGANIIP